MPTAALPEEEEGVTEEVADSSLPLDDQFLLERPLTGHHHHKHLHKHNHGLNSSSNTTNNSSSTGNNEAVSVDSDGVRASLRQSFERVREQEKRDPTVSEQDYSDIDKRIQALQSYLDNARFVLC
jgi:hypothetical protein